MTEAVKSVGHQQAVKLLHNKFVVVLGDSIQRSVYKDLVLLLQNNKYLTTRQLQSKGEQSFECDSLVEGGRLGLLHNGTEYREVRQYRTDHHLVRFYFITRIYSPYMRGILSDFRREPKPDVVIVNSCIWDISRYTSDWVRDYERNLHKFFDDLKGALPSESLIIWNMTMPLGEKIRGGFLVPEIEYKAKTLRSDVIEANFFSGTLADDYGLDVLDLHFQFRFFLQHRVKDGVHWNAVAHRRISWLLLQHVAQAWGVVLPSPLSVENHGQTQRNRRRRNVCVFPRVSSLRFAPPLGYFSHRESAVPLPPPPRPRPLAHRQDFCSDSTDAVSHGFVSFEEPRLKCDPQQGVRRRLLEPYGSFRPQPERHQWGTERRRLCAPYSAFRPQHAVHRPL